MSEEQWDPEAPNDEDVQRFGGDTAKCPGCGHEVYDDAPRCPACGKYLSGSDRMGPGRLPQWLVVLILIIMLISFVFVCVM
jgi:hypothetical protein